MGVDVTADRFLAKTKEASADVVAMPALLSTTFPHMREVVDAIRKAQLQSKVIVLGPL